MLFLRSPPPMNLKLPPPKEGYDYEIRALGGLDQGTRGIRLATKGNRAKELFLTPTMGPLALRQLLRKAYWFLDCGSLSTVPLEFHIKRSGRERIGERVDLSFFTRARLDLHPAVLLRALPRGVFQALAPQVSLEAREVVWLIAPEHLKTDHINIGKAPDAGLGRDVWMARRKMLKNILDIPNSETQKD
jgi:hypothetical protein